MPTISKDLLLNLFLYITCSSSLFQYTFTLIFIFNTKSSYVLKRYWVKERHKCFFLFFGLIITNM